ncbi:MAG: phospholipase, partial [Muribaculaceae bacterium]|nr:phospholipase [Muribaculaceae bacterium]
PMDTEIIYYDDEELDRYIGRGADEYTPAEEEEFRDVLMSLLPEDVAGWSRSIQLRKITLPTGIRDELLMIVRELRDN